MSGKLRIALVLVVLAVTATACSTRRTRRDNSFPPVQVHVDNLNFYDATVYALWRSDRRRLGVVGGNSRTSFTTTWIGPDLTFEVTLLAGRTYRTATIGTSPGDELVLEIPSANVNALRVYKR